MEKLLTVVIPTYNIQNYIGTCLESFCIPEIMDKIEVLVINDGSKDKSANIVSKYVKQYPNTFILINKENGGHGSTINTAIPIAKGKYFKVVDGDDWVEKKAFLNLVLFLENQDSDIVATNYYWVDEQSKKRKIEFRHPFSNVIYKKQYQMKEISGKAFIKMHSMSIKTEILRRAKVKLDEHCYYVDVEYIMLPIPYVKTVIFLDEFVYMYRIGLETQSMNPSNMRRNLEHHEKVFERMLNEYKKYEQNGDITTLNYYNIGLGRMLTSWFKIILSFPPTKYSKQILKNYDNRILLQYPNIYYAVTNKAVWLLRNTNYKLYYLASLALRIKERK